MENQNGFVELDRLATLWDISEAKLVERLLNLEVKLLIEECEKNEKNKSILQDFLSEVFGIKSIYNDIECRKKDAMNIESSLSEKCFNFLKECKNLKNEIYKKQISNQSKKYKQQEYVFDLSNKKKLPVKINLVILEKDLTNKKNELFETGVKLKNEIDNKKSKIEHQQNYDLEEEGCSLNNCRMM